MAIINYTEAELQSILHRVYEKNVSTPASDDSEYLFRRGLLSDGVEKWGGVAHEENVRWKTLFTNLVDATTGDKTASVNTTAYAAPDNFLEISSYVTITNPAGGILATYFYADPNEVLNKLRQNSSESIFYVTGSPNGGYTVNINAPVAGTINYSYYKTPTVFTATTDVSECPKPYYLIYNALSVLFEEERPDLSNKYTILAKNLMNDMLIDNSIAPYNNSQQIHDFQNAVNGVAMGT